MTEPQVPQKLKPGSTGSPHIAQRRCGIELMSKSP